jgi:GNAT superfamily N-acetyltransferase
MQPDPELTNLDALTIETIDRRQIRESSASVIAELLCTVWPKPDRTVESRTVEMLDMWHDYCGPESQFPRSFVIRSADQVIAHAEVGPRFIGTGVGEMTIGALAGVCTDPRVRKKGLGKRIVRAVFELIDVGIYQFALFQNYEDKRAFYENLGARAIDNPIVNSSNSNPRLNPFWADLTMIYPADKPWPIGEVDLRGPGY